MKGGDTFENVEIQDELCDWRSVIQVHVRSNP